MGFFSLALLIILVWYLFIHLENDKTQKMHQDILDKLHTLKKSDEEKKEVENVSE